MNVRLIEGNTFGAVEKAIFQAIREENNKRSSIVIIVPDQYTQAMERELLAELNVKCSFNVEVISFYRLAKRSIKQLNAELNQETSVLLLSRIIREHREELLRYKTVAMRSQFAGEMYAVITSIRNNSVSAETFFNVANEMGGYGGSKLHDIALILREYVMEIANNYADITSIIDDFARAVPTLPEVAQTSYYVFGFYEMTKTKQDVVAALMENAKRVTLGVANIAECSNSQIMPSDAKALIGMAKANNAIVSHVSDETLTAEQTAVLNKLYSYELAAVDVENNQFELVKLRSEEEEARFVAERIAELIRRANYRYRDIAVVCENYDKYSYLLHRYFTDYGIEYHIDQSRAMSDMPQYKFLRAALRAKLQLRREEILILVKESLFDVDYSYKTDFENYTLKYNVNYDQFKREFSLGKAEEREVPERVRSLVMKYLNMLGTDAASASEHVADFAALMDTVRSTAAARVALDNDGYSLELYDLAWVKLDKSLIQTATMLTKGLFPLADIAETVLGCLADIKLSLAPIGIDNVFVGGLDDSRFERVKALFVLGAGEDCYPEISVGRGILRDNEIEKLGKRGVILEPGAAERIRRKKFAITQLLQIASDKVIITDGRIRENTSVLVKQIGAILNIKPKQAEVNIRACDSDTEIATKIGTKSNYERIICRYIGMGGNDKLKPIMSYIYSKADKNKLAGMFENSQEDYCSPNNKVCFKDNYLKISGIEQFYKCPFAFYANIMLKLKDRPEGEVLISEMGSFIHRVLELFFGEVKEYDIGEEELFAKAGELVARVTEEEDFEHFARQDSSGNYINQLVHRCCFILTKLCKMQRRSKFTPTYLEYSFGMKNTNSMPLELEINGVTYKIRGIIDRVDEYGDDVLLIDYKSSLAELSLESVFSGERLQLIVYLDAILRDTGKSCVGLYYLGVPYKYEKSDNDEAVERYNYNGFVTNITDKLEDQDCDYDNGKKGFLPLKYVKTRGEEVYTPSLSGKTMLSQAEFDMLRKYVKQLLGRTIKVIEDGYIKPKPNRRMCEYCGLMDFCRVSLAEVGEKATVKVEWGNKDDGSGSDSEMARGNEA